MEGDIYSRLQFVAVSVDSQLAWHGGMAQWHDGIHTAHGDAVRKQRLKGGVLKR